MESECLVCSMRASEIFTGGWNSPCLLQAYGCFLIFARDCFACIRPDSVKLKGTKLMTPQQRKLYGDTGVLLHVYNETSTPAERKASDPTHPMPLCLSRLSSLQANAPPTPRPDAAKAAKAASGYAYQKVQPLTIAIVRPEP